MVFFFYLESFVSFKKTKMLPRPFKWVHDKVQFFTGFGVFPLNEHLVQPRPNDTFLVSYPKSGNTWIRFIISNLMFRNSETDFKNVENRVPDIHNFTPGKIMNAQQPRVLKSHFPFKPEYPKVLYIARNPKSVVISEYYYFQREGKEIGDGEFDTFLNAFLKGPIPEYGNWGAHVNSWLCGMEADTRNFLVIRYEDMKEKPEVYARKIADFIGIDVSDNEISKAVSKSSIEKMKEKEDKKQSIPFVRSGKTTEWENVLSDEQEKLIEESFGMPMKKLGYL